MMRKNSSVTPGTTKPKKLSMAPVMEEDEISLNSYLLSSNDKQQFHRTNTVSEAVCNFIGGSDKKQHTSELLE